MLFEPGTQITIINFSCTAITFRYADKRIRVKFSGGRESECCTMVIDSPSAKPGLARAS